MNHNEAAPLRLRLFRYSRLLIQLLSGLSTVAILFPFYGRERRWRAVQRWSGGITAILGMEIRVNGELPPPGSALLGVANHVSWIDIQVIHSVWRVRFVAKSEVRDWPAIGWLAARTGTLFIERGRHRHAARINRAIHEAFAVGDAVAVFPEGTTTDGTELLRFHASLLQPAVDEHASVVPVAIRYLDGNGSVDRAPAYVGDTSLLQSIAMIISRPRLRVDLHFLPAIDAQGKSRRELASAAHAAVAAALRLPIAGSAPETPSGPPGVSPTASAPIDSRYPAQEGSV